MMTTDNPLLWVLVLYVLGFVSGVIAPFLIERLENPETEWEWTFVWGRLLAALLVFLPVAFGSAEAIETIGALGYVGAFFAGLGAGQVGREVQKAGHAIKVQQERARLERG